MMKFVLCGIVGVLLVLLVAMTIVRAKVGSIVTLATVYEDAVPPATPELPQELEYLRPALVVLAAIPAEELGDANDDAAGAVDKAIATRTAGLNETEKRRVLEADLRLMASWLKHPSNQNDAPGHFALGHYMGVLMYGE